MIPSRKLERLPKLWLLHLLPSIHLGVGYFSDTCGKCYTWKERPVVRVNEVLQTIKTGHLKHGCPVILFGGRYSGGVFS